MSQRGGSAGSPKLPRSHRPPRRDWRSLLLDLEQMVPWPPGGGGPRTQAQVLANVLGYLRYLQSTLSIIRGGAGPPEDFAAAELGLAGQKLVPYEEQEEEEEEGGGPDPWLCPFWGGAAWLGLGGGVPLSPCPPTPPPPPRRGGALGLSPSLLAPPPAPGPPEEVVRDLFTDVHLGGGGAGGTPPLSPPPPNPGAKRPPGAGGGDTHRSQGGPPRSKKKCVNGFIMFCRLNRKRYMSAHPGLTSTGVTRELAQLWRRLGPDERRLYCLRARRFNLLHDRAVRPRRHAQGGSPAAAASPPALELLGGLWSP